MYFILHKLSESSNLDTFSLISSLTKYLLSMYSMLDIISLFKTGECQYTQDQCYTLTNIVVQKCRQIETYVSNNTIQSWLLCGGVMLEDSSLWNRGSICSAC